MGKVIQSLDKFPEVDFKVFEHVMRKGRFVCRFDTAKQAAAIRFRFLRLRESLKAHNPDNPMTKAAQLFTFKVEEDLLLITVKEQDAETQRMYGAMNDPDSVFLSTDAEEAVTLAADNGRRDVIADPDYSLEMLLSMGFSLEEIKAVRG